jgi:hypothetical protein
MRFQILKMLFGKTLFVFFHFFLMTFKVLYKILKNNSATSFYILNVGGFGHTISQAELYYEEIDSKGVVLLLFTPSRHNPLVSEFYPNQYECIKRSSLFFLLKLPEERHIIVLAEKIVIKFIKLIYKTKLTHIVIYDYSDYLALVPAQEAENRKRIGGVGMVQFYSMFEEGRNKNLAIRNNVVFPSASKIKQALKIEEGQKTCAFYFRRKGEPDNPKFEPSEFIRNSRKIEDLVPIFNRLTSLGIKVLLYGDQPESGIEIAKQAGVIFSDDAGIPVDSWNIWIPVIADFTIAGSNGGGLLPAIKFQKKLLIIDGFDFSFGAPNAVHTFKIVRDLRTGYISPLYYLTYCPWERGFLADYKVESIPNTILVGILDEFLSYLSSWPKDNFIRYKVHNDSLLAHSPNALISTKYIEYLNDKIFQQ